jgi:AraC family transcriptional regulator
MKLAIGEFLGIPIRIRSVAGFIFTEYRYPKETVLRRHSHELAYFSFVLNGSYVERCFPARLKYCCRETALYHPAEEDHADTFGKGGGWIFSMEVGPTWMHRLHDYELKTGEPLTLTSVQALALNRRLYKAFLDINPVSDLILQATATELLCQLSWKGLRGPESRVPPWLRQAVEILRSEFRSPFSLLAIAERVGTHPVHLARTFQHHHGMTMGAYVRQLRVAYVMDALRRNESRLAAIATEAGFSDQSHLGRTFKAITGMTPHQFRLNGRR